MTSLRSKLVRLIIAQLAVLGLAGTGLSVYLSISDFRQSQARIEDQAERSLASRGQLLLRNQALSFTLLVADYALSDMAQLVEGTVEADPDVMYGLVTDSEGEILAFASREAPGDSRPKDRVTSQASAAQVLDLLQLDDGSVPPRNARTRSYHAFGVSLREFATPIHASEGHLLGTLRYGFSTEQMRQELHEARERQRRALRTGLFSTLGVSLAAILLGLWLSLRQSRRITEPVQALTTAAGALAEGRRDVRVDIRSGDELQLLGDAFNHMVQELRASYDWLEQSNRKLSEEIATREVAEQERRQAERQLAQSQKMEAVGQLAGGVAHDFNNLLTVIQGRTELAQMRLESPPDGTPNPVDMDLDEISEAAQRASNLTRQLLAFSRHDEDKPRVVQLSHVVEGVQRMLQRLLRENIEFDIETDHTDPSLCIDPGRLEQVVMNLAINAGDAMPDGGRLRVCTKEAILDEPAAGVHGVIPAGRYALLTVQDTGKGIAEADLLRVFDAFYTTKPLGKGTGLGLATVDAIVRGAGGHIELESRVDRGTTFRIYFPAVEGALQSLPGSAQHVPRGNGEWILLCEDDDAVREVSETFLKEYGYLVASFSNPKSLLSSPLLRSCDFQILVTDVVMPDMSGPELARALSKHLPDLPVLYLSGYTAGALEDYGLDEDSEQLLPKPFTSQQLRHQVARMLEFKRVRSA